ncbi:SUF system FeS assembly protein, NifU family [Spirochaeta thermophila DSM 6578]|uniref:SUF system FeS assembly protein, NifU family n=1 Tax=Winmispira thermophila (strain ATCC 700085 / DSM 6578 / Z-1203) TaxID=869211 RepID=G0G9X5_WINT7|nr:SUF system NifU family Fe-S cluster assembly protein [Spirochaeta thermophila]AEJ60875.1 SUF system FeS assembly protein, NifU family [Spirochaeta thermophila DSM 6578]
MHDDLYQEILLDHYRHPRNKRPLPHIPESRAHENPTCGDSVKLEVKLHDGVIEEVAFDGKGCAIDTASASIMTELLKGKTVEEALALAEKVIRMIRGEDPTPFEEFGDLVVFSGLSAYPVRVKCATLPWHALLDEISKLRSDIPSR